MSVEKKEIALPPTGDMPAEEFRLYGHRAIDWIARYLSDMERYPVLSQSRPGDLKNALPASAPAEGESFEAIFADFERFIIPGVTHWNHAGFFAYIANSASMPAILGELFSAALNINAMLWRTSPAATELEEITTNWLRQMIALPENFSAVIYDTASISTLCAIAAAREAVQEINVREEGLAASPQRLRLYASDQAHSSVEKGAITLGLGQNSVRKIASDSSFRMKPDALAEAIGEDRRAGWRPFCVTATTGTTSTGSIDPVPEIADICERESLWLHVDAAYGGSTAVLPEMRGAFAGWERADSIVINPHKWLFVPVDLSALYCRRMDILGQAFSLVPEYLKTAEADEVKNFMDYGPQLGRRLRALKFWFVLRYFGVEGIRSRIRSHLEMAREFGRWIEESRDFELLAPVPLAIVCFRAEPRGFESESEIDTLNERLMTEVNRRGRIFISHTRLDGRFTLRLVVGNIRTTREHIQMAWEELNSALELCAK
ncbi:MAG: pyridoxal-dependent decarboxylase [Acidobacteriota bacterium]